MFISITLLVLSALNTTGVEARRLACLYVWGVITVLVLAVVVVVVVLVVVDEKVKKTSFVTKDLVVVITPPPELDVFVALLTCFLTTTIPHHQHGNPIHLIFHCCSCRILMDTSTTRGLLFVTTRTAIGSTTNMGAFAVGPAAIVLLVVGCPRQGLMEG